MALPILAIAKVAKGAKALKGAKAAKALARKKQLASKFGNKSGNTSMTPVTPSNIDYNAIGNAIKNA
jgi:hypothetical protein|tara:strand:- start:3002 stop:3202 length:201 start_codon:yes stop_codon:yes gene_type:complete